MRAFLAALVAGLILAGLFVARAHAGMWSVPLFYTGLCAAVYLPIYDLVTDGQMKNAILLVPLTLLVAAAVARFMGI